MEWLKVKALSSSPSTTKRKKKVWLRLAEDGGLASSCVIQAKNFLFQLNRLSN
jgi:hypothetical protein